VTLQLAVVMPVYNEAACIRRVVESWLSVLGEHGIDFRLIVINDGSSDRTAEELDALPPAACLDIIHKTNSGHGPSILLGYRKAASQAEWVFQCDSDGEIDACFFPAMWEARDDFDALMGIRRDRGQSLARRFITRCSRFVVHASCGGAVEDVNVPWRLIRARMLSVFLPEIPEGTFAPNIIMSGMLALGGYRVENVPVEYKPRSTGVGSLGGWRLWRSAIKSFGQTLSWRVRIGMRLQPLPWAKRYKANR